MGPDEHRQPEEFSDDIMLSSAEDLNLDGGFMGPSPDENEAPNEDDDITRAVEDLLHEEPSGEIEEVIIKDVVRPVEPVMAEQSFDEPREGYGHVEHEHHKKHHEHAERSSAMMPDDEPPRRSELRRRAENIRCDDECGSKKRNLHAPEPQARVVTAQSYQGINKLALAWMILLTIVLGGVMGIMIYAFILGGGIFGNNNSQGNIPDSSQQENLQIIAGALEVYLTEVNLDNYNTDIVLINGGGLVTLTGTLKHTVYVNSTSATTLVLKGVTIESPDNVALVNLSKNDMVLTLEGANTLTSGGGKYGAALYSVGMLSIKGDGKVMIYSGKEGSTGIVSERGYQVNGASVVALGQGAVEQPIDDSTQAYFAKNLPQVYKEGSIVTARDEDSVEVVKFTAPGDFASIFVSNSRLEDGVEYRISIGSGEAK